MAKEKCHNCHGSGQVYCGCDGGLGSSSADDDCPACGGTGKHTCPACGGSGYES